MERERYKRSVVSSSEWRVEGSGEVVGGFGRVYRVVFLVGVRLILCIRYMYFWNDVFWKSVYFFKYIYNYKRRK